MVAKKHLHLVFALLMSFTLGFLMTAFITAINTGLHGDFFLRWGKAFMFAWPLAFILVLLIGKHVRSAAERICSA